MKFKLDENFGARTLSIFQAAGHNVETVVQEALGGAADRELYQVCRDEKRCLVTVVDCRNGANSHSDSSGKS